jgi:hypothetical protein
MSTEDRAPLVEAYSFGSIRVRGKTYDGDIVILGNTISEWWREEGHLVSAADIAPILAQGPRVLVIGTGASGRMNVSAEAAALCSERGVELSAQPTRQATKLYNTIVLEGKRSVAGAFHVTC